MSYPKDANRACAADTPAVLRNTPGWRLCTHLDQRVGLGQVVAAGRLVVEVARVRLRKPVAAAEHIAAAALEPGEPNLQHGQALLSLAEQRQAA